MSKLKAGPGGWVLVSAGAYAPSTVFDNTSAAEAAGVTEEWIVQRTGILERRVAEPGEGTARMAELAARQALQRAALDASAVELIIVATSTPNHLTPPTACEVQAALGAFGAACFDIEAGFAGWLYALLVADALMSAGAARCALVIGAEKLSTVTDRGDPATGPLFGDGAGAVVLQRDGPGRRLGARSWWADGRLADVLLRPGGGAQRPFDEQVLEEGTHLLRMEGVRLFRRAVRTMARQTALVLERARLQLDDIDLVIPHQANLRILHAFAGEAGIPLERVFVNITHFGNTGSATIPIALAEAMHTPAFTAARRILLVSFGAGATAGAVLLE